jgi:hypothetical protein
MTYFTVLSQLSPRGTEENHEIHQSALSALETKMEPTTYVGGRIATAMSQAKKLRHI